MISRLLAQLGIKYVEEYAECLQELERINMLLDLLQVFAHPGTAECDLPYALKIAQLLPETHRMNAFELILAGYVGMGSLAEAKELASLIGRELTFDELKNILRVRVNNKEKSPEKANAAGDEMLAFLKKQSTG